MSAHTTEPDLRTTLEHLVEAHGLKSVLEALHRLLQAQWGKNLSDLSVPNQILDVARKVLEAAKLVP